MRFRARNPNPAWPARHTIYLATTGGGKSQALRANPDIPRRGARVVGWDHAGDHPGLHFYGRASFLRALIQGVKSGGGFRVFYAGDKTVEAFEWWCEVVWSMLDGDQQTFAIVEELSRISPGAAKASPNAAELWNEGRKFGLILHGTSQKPQDVAKTFVDQSDVKYIGQQKGLAMARRMALEIGITTEEIRALQPLQFYRDEGRADAPKLITVPFREREGVIWRD